MIVWLTGQPGSGKTTIAKAVKDIHWASVIIDGDDLRKIYANKDYSRAGRRKNVRQAQGMAADSADNGLLVVVALVSPYRDLREKFKADRGDVREFYLTSNRDLKVNFHVKDYEPPIFNFTLLNTDELSIEDCVKAVERALVPIAQLGRAEGRH